MKKIFFILFLVIILIGCNSDKDTNKSINIKKTTSVDSNINKDTVKESTGTKNNLISNEMKFIVDPNKIQSGGPPMDGIPSIDNPKFTTVKEADKWIKDNELVLAIIYKNKKKVYPLQILVWHEIVNDVIDNDPILITYCPLCGTGIAYKRTINGEAVEFGTSGKLYNSNLVMYDRKTKSYWSQIDGKAIVGKLTGMHLKELSIDTVTWKEWKTAYPDSEVLTTETGYKRAYGSDPYGSYYEDSFLLFPVESESNLVHPKTIIYGIEINGKYKAYKEEDMKKNIIKDKFANTNIELTKNGAGIIKVTNVDTNEEIVKERGFWFSWYAFHPETELYGVEKK